MRAELFLGFPLTESLMNKIQGLDPRAFDMYVNEKGPYLKKIEYGNQSFLGKSVGSSADIAKIKLLEANIFSILAKILPDYPFKNDPLLLFATTLRD